MYFVRERESTGGAEGGGGERENPKQTPPTVRAEFYAGLKPTNHEFRT